MTSPALLNMSSSRSIASERIGSNHDTDERDIEWMQLVRQGDQKAFAKLVEYHKQSVIGTIAKMLGPDYSAEVEDIAQQVFVRVWKSAPRYEPMAKFTTWLFTITRNLVFSELRKRRYQFASRTESLDALPVFHQIPDPKTKDTDPKSALLQSELQSAIDNAIAELPKTQRMALILRRYENLPYEEIARVLDLTVPTVKSMLFRARGKLRVSLADYLKD